MADFTLEQVRAAIAAKERQQAQPQQQVTPTSVQQAQPQRTQFTLPQIRAAIARKESMAETQQPKQEPLSAPAQLTSDVGSGFMGGVASLLGTPVDLGTLALRGAGVDLPQTVAFGSSHIKNLFRKIGLIRDPVTETGRFIQRAAEEVGASAIPVAGMARRIASTGGDVARFLGRELGSASAAGIGAATAQEVAPGSIGAELIGTMAPSAIGAAGSGLTRGIIRGGEAGRQRVQSSIEQFERAGTAPTVGIATQREILLGFERTLSGTPGSRQMWAQRSNQVREEIEGRVNEIIENLAGGAQVSAERAGREIQTGLDSFSIEAREKSKSLWTPVRNAFSPDTRVPVSHTAAALDEMTNPVPGAAPLSEAMQQIRSPQARRLSEGFIASLSDDGTIPYVALGPFRSAVGELIESPTLAPNISRSQLKRLYGAITGDIKESLRTIPSANGQASAIAQFERANRFTRGLHKRVDGFLDKINNKVSPEEIFFSATTGIKGRKGGTQARALMRSLGQEQKNIVSATLIDMLGTGNVGREGDFTIEKFFNGYSKMSEDAKLAFFSGNKIQGLKGSLDAIEGAIKKINESALKRTLAPEAQSVPTATGFGLMYSLLSGNLAGIATVAGTAGMSGIISKKMKDPKFVKWLAQSTKIPAEKMPAHIARLATVSEGQSIISQEDTADFISGLNAMISSMGDVLPEKNPPPNTITNG